MAEGKHERDGIQDSEGLPTVLAGSPFVASQGLASAAGGWHHAHDRKANAKEASIADPQQNKETVIAYYNMAFNERKPADAAQKYGGPYYTQHNPQAPDGFEAFVGFVEGFAEQFPQMSLEIKRAIAEGDMVVTHSLLKTTPEDRGTAAADFFRLEDGKVVEHWDVLQPVPESAANDHPMF